MNRLRCALLSSFNLDQLPGMVDRGFSSDLSRPEWYIAPYGQAVQELLNDSSGLFAFAPEVLFLALAPEDWFGGLHGEDGRMDQDEAANRLAELAHLVEQAVAKLPGSKLFIHEMMLLQPQVDELYALKDPFSMHRLCLEANLTLARLAEQHPGVYVLSLAGLFAQCGRQVFDARFYYLGRMRFGRNALESLAGVYRKVIHAYRGNRKKVIVLDLDQTLWGGILGEDGPENLRIAPDSPQGGGYRDFQRLLMRLNHSGVLLALCSKNDEALALKTLTDHPDMVLRPEHFAAWRINWQDKAANLREIAEELGLSLSSFVFLDDSPYERELIRQALPEVEVPDLPVDSADYPAFLAGLENLTALTVTQEDRLRGKMYTQDRRRRDLQAKSTHLEDFLASLQIVVSIQALDRYSLSRLAQLIQRTNQFNLTTRRYTEAELSAMLGSTSWRIYILRTSDRIGDNGVVGAVLLETSEVEHSVRMDNLLLSCRVLGRGIEKAFLAGVFGLLSKEGYTWVQAEYLPTERNQMARSFLPDAGFVETNGMWRREMVGAEELCPDWISLEWPGV